MKSHFASGGLVLGVGVCIAIAAIAARAAETNGLRLVPHPKKVTPGDGTFDLQGPLVLEKASGVGDTEAAVIIAELQRAGLPAPKVAAVATDGLMLRLSANRPRLGPRANSGTALGPKIINCESHAMRSRVAAKDRPACSTARRLCVN